MPAGVLHDLKTLREKLLEPVTLTRSMHKARYWQKRQDGSIVCELCPRLCVLNEGQAGGCGVRIVKDGTLWAASYGKPCAVHVDPVEKKPLYHFYPGESIFSLATIGCNLYCDFCQNWEISKARIERLRDEQTVPAEKIIELAEKAGCRLIAFTYTEPTVFFEYMIDIATAAKQRGMECAIVSNGYINEEPLQQLIPLISAANIDLKGPEAFYKKRCKVLDYERIKTTITSLKKSGVHIEITNLLIPNENDSDEEMEELARWVSENVGRDTPLHFSAFHPDYKLLQKESTPATTLLKARAIAQRHLDFIYLGNIADVENDTRCPNCATIVIKRTNYRGESLLKDGTCPLCGTVIAGRFSGTTKK